MGVGDSFPDSIGGRIRAFEGSRVRVGFTVNFTVGFTGIFVTVGVGVRLGAPVGEGEGVIVGVGEFFIKADWIFTAVFLKGKKILPG